MIVLLQNNSQSPLVVFEDVITNIDVRSLLEKLFVPKHPEVLRWELFFHLRTCARTVPKPPIALSRMDLPLDIGFVIYFILSYLHNTNDLKQKKKHLGIFVFLLVPGLPPDG